MIPETSGISENKDIFLEFKKSVSREKRAIRELSSFLNNLKETANEQDKKNLISQINAIKNSIKRENRKISGLIENISLIKPLHPDDEKREESEQGQIQEEDIKKGKHEKIPRDIEISDIEKGVLKKLKQKEKKIVERKERKPNAYVKKASQIFSNYSRDLIDKGLFESTRLDLIKAGMNIPATSYISIIFFTTMLVGILALILFVFFLFFSLSLNAPFISLAQESIGIRFMKTFWVLILPIATFLFMYIYPSLEKKSKEVGINRELPFATINMSAISGSLIDPTKIFAIIVSTNEYPYLEKEFKKLINEINIYGYDLVTALKNAAFRSPSKKLIELCNGLATTINSGGDLAEFFNKRAETLLLEHRLEREKYTKTTETFMDIYISVVIAAPMILMLLLMMMQISGLGISLSPPTISLIMVVAISIVNIIFLSFLHLKQPGE